MFAYFSDLHLLLSLITLTFLEIILGIDNIIFITLITNQLPANLARRARVFGVGVALILRILMLLGIEWLINLKIEIFHIGKQIFTIKDLIFIAGGLFLLYSAVKELYKKLVPQLEVPKNTEIKNVWNCIMYIIVIDIIFSIDSIMTAIGMTKEIPIIMLAMIISMLVMICASEALNRVLQLFPRLNIVCIAFLILISIVLLAEGFHYEIPKEYLYFSLGFSILIETVNIFIDRKSKKS